MKPYWQDGASMIYHGDCREILGELSRVPLILTDPPYARSGSRNEWKVTASVAIGLHLSASLVSKGGAMFVFSTSSGRGIEFVMGAIGDELAFNRILTWHKTFVRSRVAGPWRWDTVSILGFGRCSFGRPEATSCFRSTGPASTKALGSTGHPAELPDGLGDWLYWPFEEQMAGVLDPFCGTGQLLVPAARLGHPAIGIEIDERWCEVAAKRLERIGSGEAVESHQSSLFQETLPCRS